MKTDIKLAEYVYPGIFYSQQIQHSKYFLNPLSAALIYLTSVWDLDQRKKKPKSLFKKSAVKDSQKKEVMQEDCVLLARYLKGKSVLYLCPKSLKIHCEELIIHINCRLHSFFIWDCLFLLFGKFCQGLFVTSYFVAQCNWSIVVKGGHPPLF